MAEATDVAPVPHDEVVAILDATLPGLRARPVRGEIDALLDEAHLSGWIEQRVWLSEDLDETEQAAAFVLAQLPSAQDVFVVTDRLSCYRVSARALATLRSFIDGDTIFVPVVTPRVIVLHHSGWAFVLASASTNTISPSP